MRNKNLLIGAVLVAAIALVAVLAAVLPSRIAPPTEEGPTLAPTEVVEATEEPQVTQTPEATEEPEATVTVTTPSGETASPAPGDSAEPEATFDPSSVKGWLVVTVGNSTYQPLPLIAEGDYSVTQESGAENVIHVTENSVEMKTSTWDNQDCVKQGVVPLANMEERLLGNMIICLPNQVTLSLYTTEELLALLSGE